MSDIPETIISKGPQKKVASAPAKEKTALPQTIGKYKVISVIAKGGIGAVREPDDLAVIGSVGEDSALVGI